jgi:hypothetical protein
MNTDKNSKTGEGSDAPRVWKYEIGQRVSRFGVKVTITDREVSPLGYNVYHFNEVYKGIVENVSGREDELRPV